MKEKLWILPVYSYFRADIPVWHVTKAVKSASDGYFGADNIPVCYVTKSCETCHFGSDIPVRLYLIWNKSCQTGCQFGMKGKLQNLLLVKVTLGLIYISQTAFGMKEKLQNLLAVRTSLGLIHTSQTVCCGKKPIVLELSKALVLTQHACC